MSNLTWNPEKELLRSKEIEALIKNVKSGDFDYQQHYDAMEKVEEFHKDSFFVSDYILRGIQYWKEKFVRIAQCKGRDEISAIYEEFTFTDNWRDRHEYTIAVSDRLIVAAGIITLYAMENALWDTCQTQPEFTNKKDGKKHLLGLMVIDIIKKHGFRDYAHYKEFTRTKDEIIAKVKRSRISYPINRS